MIPSDAILKHQPGDFVVRENMMVQLTPRQGAEQHYLLLRKCGYTTMEACRRIATEFGLTSRAVAYGGLKDEDAITEQMVSLPIDAATPEALNGGWTLHDEPHRWLQLQHYGYGREPLAIGALEGNGFQIVIRNLDSDGASVFESVGKLSSLFLNYYDTQRFGVPGGPKRTHHVGEAILEARWDDARRELISLGAAESAMARDATNAPAFFLELDPRTVAFYLSAHGSHQWNQLLRSHVTTLPATDRVAVEVEGITYDYVTATQSAARLMADVVSLPQSKYEFREGVAVEIPSQRATVVQTAMTVTDVGDDDQLPGRYAASVRFFLPSGTYATAAIRQLLWVLAQRQPVGAGS